jgi:hypothetical protein
MRAMRGAYWWRMAVARSHWRNAILRALRQLDHNYAARMKLGELYNPAVLSLMWPYRRDYRNRQFNRQDATHPLAGPYPLVRSFDYLFLSQRPWRGSGA